MSVVLTHSSYSLKYFSSKGGGGGFVGVGVEVGVGVGVHCILYNKYLNGSDNVYKKLYGRWYGGVCVGAWFFFIFL